MVWASWAGGGGVLVVSEFFDKESNFFWGVGGGAYFSYKLTRNPDLTISFFFFFFFGGGGESFFWGGGERESKCTYMNKCFKWHFYSPRRTSVQNYFEIHAYM